MTAKQAAQEIIQKLPDNASLDEVMHALYLKAKFDRGVREIEAGGGIPHAQAKERLQKWLR